MADLIDRQLGIDALDTIASEVADGDGFQYEKWRQYFCELPSAQPEQRWISCRERLPERGKDVLVTRHYDGRIDYNKSCNYVEIASCYGEDDDVVWNSYSDEYKVHPKRHIVIAWMPLPSPYREDDI